MEIKEPNEIGPAIVTLVWIFVIAVGIFSWGLALTAVIKIAKLWGL
jgi:hypothetical protein